MRLLAVPFALCAAAACAHNTASPPATPALWVQVWSDEFDGPVGTRVDAAKWTYDVGDGCQQGNCGWGNNEKEYYTDAVENVALNGQGQLAIVARTASTALTCYYGPCRYTSGKITTRGLMDVTPPGRVEARIKLSAGQGLWPAFWMLGSDIATTSWPACGELDIMENKGSQPTISSSAVHGPGYSGGDALFHVQPLQSGSLASDFHTFAVEWDSNGAKFFVDGVPHYFVTRANVQQHGPFVFDKPFFVILNLAVGGHFDGDPASDAIFPATMLVDYVRVFRRP